MVKYLRFVFLAWLLTTGIVLLVTGIALSIITGWIW